MRICPGRGIENSATVNTTAKSTLGLLALSIALTVPVFLFGIPGGNDLPQHYQFASTYFDALSNGDLLPSWSVNANEGLGDLGIRVYPPAAYYYLAGLRLISGNWYLASAFTFFILFFASGIGTYAWARQWFSERSALLAGAVYILAPFHVN